MVPLAGVTDFLKEPQDGALRHTGHTAGGAYGIALAQGGEDSDAFLKGQAVHKASIALHA